MAHEIGDLLKAQRPFPNDVQASFDACEDTFEADVATFEELTPEKIAAVVMEAARGHRYLCFRISHGGTPPDFDEIGRRFKFIRAELAKHVTERMLATMHGGSLAAERSPADTYQVRLYGHEEVDVPPERVAHARAMLLQAGLDPDLLDGGEKPIVH